MSEIQPQNIASAYAHCLAIAQNHYENFPTASFLLNPTQRNATAAIYAFARTADDIADEGNLDAATRHQQMDKLQDCLSRCYLNDNCPDPIFIALADTIQRYAIPEQTLASLLVAFNMDIDKQRYADFEELIEYCTHSANPVGELVLRIHGCCSDQALMYSNAICSALQLINFLQDIDEDLQQRNRIYIPMNEMRAFSVSEDALRARRNSPELHALLQHQLVRARNMLLTGSQLVDMLHGKLKLVIKLTICGGLTVCDKLQQRQDSFTRPRLSRLDWVKITLRAFGFSADRARAKIQQTQNPE